jgi:cephalosporin-C deacetylase-like acetyl esterase
MACRGRFVLRSRVSTAWPGNDRVPFLHLRRNGHGKGPGLVLLHGYGMRKEQFTLPALVLRRLGCSVVVPDLPLHGDRCPGSPAAVAADLLASAELDTCALLFRQAAQDVQACLDWLGDQPEVDDERLGVIGFSLGGILAALVLGLDTRPRAGVSVVGAGDLAGLILGSPMASAFRQRLARHGYGPEQVKEALREVDPLTYAPRIANLLMINGERDPIVPRQAVLTFWNSLDPSRHNRLVWGPWGHFPPVWQSFRQVLDHLRSRMQGLITARG